MGGEKITLNELLGEMKTQGAISQSERIALATLGKRDARHGVGSATPRAYMACGKRIARRDIIEGNGFEIQGGGGFTDGNGDLREGISANYLGVDYLGYFDSCGAEVVNGDWEFD